MHIAKDWQFELVGKSVGQLADALGPVRLAHGYLLGTDSPRPSENKR